MQKTCTDPTFLGSAIYAKVDGEVKKLSKLTQARELKMGEIVFDTQNTTYSATFSHADCRKVFLDTCRTIGRLANSQ